MCCQYYVDEHAIDEIISLVSERTGKSSYHTGEIHPSERSTVITGKAPGLKAEEMRWGFPASHTKQLLINARSETALEKPSFSESTLRRRCVIVASRFYEWDRNHRKVTFTLPEKRVIYLAGIYNCFSDGDRFTLLTTRANESMLPVHDRMPLILTKNQIEDWILDERETVRLLNQAGPQLDRSQNYEYEQMTLFDFGVAE